MFEGVKGQILRSVIRSFFIGIGGALMSSGVTIDPKLWEVVVTNGTELAVGLILALTPVVQSGIEKWRADAAKNPAQ